MVMSNETIYEERISSKKTQALFLALTFAFLVLATWSVFAHTLDVLAIVFLCFSSFFLFYVLNYRTLIIRIAPQTLQLVFGIFSWQVPFDNIDDCSLDQLPNLMRLGGAGIHFMLIRNRYRASFNFLEYPRVVIALKKKKGLVQDISFSTRHPEDILRRIREATRSRSAA
jgi:hypothetical protein